MRLTSEDGLRLFAQPDPSRARFGLRQSEQIAIDSGPFQLKGLPFAAACQEKQADDIGLRLSRGAFVDEPVQGTVKPAYLFARQEGSQFPVGVLSDALRRIGGDMAGRDRKVQDLAKQLERLVRSARCGLAVGVEPSFDGYTPDSIQAQVPEGGQKLLVEHAIHIPATRGSPPVTGCRLPLVYGEFPKQGNGKRVSPVFGTGRSRPVLKRQAVAAGFLHSLQRDRANCRSYRRTVRMTACGAAVFPTAMPARR